MEEKKQDVTEALKLSDTDSEATGLPGESRQIYRVSYSVPGLYDRTRFAKEEMRLGFGGEPTGTRTGSFYLVCPTGSRDAEIKQNSRKRNIGAKFITSITQITLDELVRDAEWSEVIQPNENRTTKFRKEFNDLYK